MINGQPYQLPPTPAGNRPIEPLAPIRKPSGWRYFFIILGILQLLSVVCFILILAWAIQQSKAGVSGTEFIVLLLVLFVVPVMGLLALLNLLTLPIYMIKRKPRGAGLIFSILSLIVSVLLAAYGAYGLYQLHVTVPKKVTQASQRVEQHITTQQQQFAADNAKPEITADEATTLLNYCQLQGFYYTKQTDKEDGDWGELSSTGVVLTKIDGKPYRISIADRLIPQLVPVARDAQKTCGGPQFWHDGNYEQFKNGHWYFEGTVVN